MWRLFSAGQSSETGGAGAVAVEPSYDPSGHHESRASIPGHHAAAMSDKDVEFAVAHEKGLTAVVLLNKFTDLAADGSGSGVRHLIKHSFKRH